PAKLVLEEAESQFGSGRKLGFLLSLGTGLKITDAAFADAEGINKRALQTQQQPRKLSGSLFSRDIRPVFEHLKSSITDTEPTHHELEQRFRLVPNAYFRLNLDKGASDIKLHQYKKMEVLREATKQYLRDPEVSATVDQIVGRLHKKEGVELPLNATCKVSSAQTQQPLHSLAVLTESQQVKIMSIASPLFTGRSEILNEFEQRFCERACGASPRRLLRIWGMGGFGKTQVALKFRDLYESRFGRVFWVHAATLDDEQTLAVDIMNETDAVALLLRSSRKKKETLDFSERLYSESVVRELGYLPLAIDQAGSYVSLHECTFGTYLAEFVKQRKDMLSDSSLYPGAFEHNPAVYGTFELSYEALEKRSRESTAKGHAALNALRVLNIFCFYHNENLTGQIIDRAATNSKVDKDVLGDMESIAPLPLLELNNDKSWNSKNYMEGIGLLRSYSLVKKSAFNEDDHSMHILVHCWARDRMRADVFKFQQRAARSILFDSFHLQTRFEEEKFLVQLVQHLKALIDRGGSDDLEWCNPSDRKGNMPGS
ncbi:protein kinase subdomain-containing protein, partial [Colletotrichum sojae]